MNKLKFLLLFSFCFGSSSAFSQKTLYLKPVIGNQEMLNRLDQSIGKPEFIEVNEIYRWNKDKLNGLMLELKLNENWQISTGYSREWLRWNYRVINPNREESKFGGYSVSRANRLHRIPIIVKKNFLKTNNYQPTSSNKLSWFDVRLFVQGGLSFDFYNLNAYNSNPYPELNNSFIHYPITDTIAIREELTTVNRHGFSALTGVGTEIYFKSKPLFEVTLFYNQGLRSLIASDVHYQVNSLSGRTRIITRGSSFGATLGIPIRLKTFKGSNKG